MHCFWSAALSAASLLTLGGGPCFAGDRDDIARVVRSCPLTPNDCQAGLVVKDIRIAGRYARASVSNPDGGGETDIAYLRKRNGRWVLLDQGTGVDPAALGAPKEIW